MVGSAYTMFVMDIRFALALDKFIMFQQLVIEMQELKTARGCGKLEIIVLEVG